MALPGCTTCQENYSLEFPVVEEIIERPNAAFFAIRIGREVWVVAGVITQKEHFFKLIEVVKFSKLNSSKVLGHNTTRILAIAHNRPETASDAISARLGR